MRRNTTHSVFRKPVPNRVVEIKDISTGGGIVKLKDRLLMLAHGQSYWPSTNGGLTWGEP